METYIVLLRGINVSGQKKILMAELRELLNSLSFRNVQTYIQSGNIVFQSKKNSKIYYWIALLKKKKKKRAILPC